jgi:NADPH2:quinone reductase
MKAIVVREFGGPEVMQLEDVPDPSPGPTQVLVRARAIGVNPVETYIRAGAYARLPNLPYIPGTDAAGTVEAVGAQVTRVAPGERVYVHGTAAGSGAYGALILADAGQVHPLPEPVTFPQGAAVGIPYVTAYRALFGKGQARPGDSVFVNGGSGAVGTAAVQLARARGIRVIATAGTDKGMELLTRLGADHVLNHTAAGYFDEVTRLTDGRGADVILEMLANVNLDRDLDILALRGRVVVVGNRGRIEIDPRKIMRKDGAVHGLMMLHITAEELREAHAALGAGLRTGAVAPVVGREMTLREAARAHAAVLEPGAYGKIVMVP